MIAIILIALAAGCASALMFASIISGALISLLLFYLAPLPLMVAALGWGPIAATIGGIVAASGLGAIFGLPYCIAFAITVALPAWWLGHLALLGRPVADPAAGNGAAPAAPQLEWYPVGRILLWIAGFAALTTIAAMLTLGTDAETITSSLRRGLSRILGARDAASSGDIERWVAALAIIAPAAATIVAMMTLTLNLWLAGKITATSGRLHRPWPDLKSAELPPMTLVALCVALAFCFVGGLVAMFAQIATTALMMAYAPHRLCRAAHADAGAQEPRLLALLHLRDRCRVRLAGAGDDRARPCRRRLRHSPTLSARQAAAPARILKRQPSTSTAYRTLKRRTKMEVILLERVAKLGQMGEVVRVKDGFARNFLLKRGKALRATADNRAKFDGMKAELEANNLKAKGEASKVAEKINGRNVVVLRQASETGQLFGSVSVRDIIASFEADGVTISRSQVLLDAPIKTIGKHQIAIAVHPEVEVSVSVTVARSADEAERINRGEDISTRQEDQDAAAEALAAAGEFFDPEAQHDDEAPAPASTEK